MTNPLFNPGPIEHPFIPIHLAAVNPYMSMVAGEVAEGVRPHPVCTPRYIKEVMWPEIRRGLDKSCRGNSHFCVAIKPLIATGADKLELDKNKEDVRARIAFYGATWAYRKTFEFNGLGKIAEKLRFLSKKNDWEKMPSLIDDDILNEYACVGLHEDIVSVLKNKYNGIVTNVEFSIPISEKNPEGIRRMVRALNSS